MIFGFEELDLAGPGTSGMQHAEHRHQREEHHHCQLGIQRLDHFHRSASNKSP